MRVRKNDHVVVIAGVNKGKKGKVLKVFPESNRVIVEGVHFIKKHMRPSQQNPQGGIIEKEGPIHVSNIMVLCPKTGVPTRLGSKLVYNDSQKRNDRVRICKKSGEMIV